MGKMFYTAAEAAEKLGKQEDDLKDLVRAGSLREFRDGGVVHYKVEDVDSLAKDTSGPSASASGEIVLEPADDEDEVDFGSASGDVLMLEEAEAGGSTAGAGSTAKKEKESTAVPSAGINIFDDDDLDEIVDPLAQTAVTDLGGLALDGSGSGSGIMELTQESDDTSLGAELLEEIYTGEEEDGVEMGDATRAGLDEAVSEETVAAEDEDAFEIAMDEPAAGPRTSVAQVVEYAPDASSTGITAAMVVAVLILWVAGLAGTSLVRGISPGLLQTLYANLPIFAGASVGVAGIAGAVAFFIKKRGG